MADSRAIRRLAFQALYQLDARGPQDAPTIREAMDRAEGFADSDRNRAFDLAVAAYDSREAADLELAALAPDWPVHRQPAVDRAILRLAHFEIVSGTTHPKIVVNEAIELAKEFSTERSPAFINGLLDRVLKRVLAKKEPTAQAVEDQSPAQNDPPAKPAEDQPPEH